MAGTKGRSGGARHGAGRPRKPAVTLNDGLPCSTPLAFLLAVARHPDIAMRLRVRAARIALPYVKTPRG